MLNGARYSAGDIELRADRFASLTDLVLMVDPAGIHDSARSTECGTENIAEVLQNRPIFRPLDAPAAGDDALREHPTEAGAGYSTARSTLTSGCRLPPTGQALM